MPRPETVLQRQILDFIRSLGFIPVHVPNGSVLAGGASQRARQMAGLKRDGLCVGFPDLIVYGEGGRICHLEVKTEGGKQSPAQRECEEWLVFFGNRYAVVRSVEDVEEVLHDWGWIDDKRERLI